MAGGISIIIVNFNTGILLIRCLDSIRAQEKIECRVIVVDNASVDNSVGFIRAGYPEVQLIVNDRNLGFAMANNQAIEKAQDDLLLFLNPDTQLEPGCLTAIREFMDTQPDIGMAGAAIVNDDGSPHCSIEDSYPGQHYSRGEVEGLPGKIAWILGAALVARKEVIAAVHGFDERFFLYAEDIDLCLEVRKQGWLLGFIADATVMHLEGQSEKNAPFAKVMERKTRAELIFFKKHYRPETFVRIRRARLFQAWWRIICLQLGAFFSGTKRLNSKKLAKYSVIASIYGQASDSEV